MLGLYVYANHRYDTFVRFVCVMSLHVNELSFSSGEGGDG